MRVEHTNIEGISEEIQRCAKNILEGIVRFRIDRDEVSEVATEVGVWVSALVQTDKGDYVIEAGLYAGTDWAQHEKKQGTEQALQWKKQIQTVCNSHELQLCGGKIEVI